MQPAHSPTDGADQQAEPLPGQTGDQQAGTLPDEAKGPRGLLRLGRKVRIEGLQSATDVNGKVGVCKSWNDDEKRWLVILNDDGKKKWVKTANLVPIQSKPKTKTVEAAEGASIKVPPGYTLSRAFFGSKRKAWNPEHGTDVTAAVKLALTEGAARGELVACEESLAGITPFQSDDKMLILELAKSERLAHHPASKRPPQRHGVVGEASDDDWEPLAPQTLVAAEGETISIPKGKIIVRAFFGDAESPFNLKMGTDVTTIVMETASETGGEVKASNRRLGLGNPLKFRQKQLFVEVIDETGEELRWTLPGAEIEGRTARTKTEDDGYEPPEQWSIRQRLMTVD